MNLVVRFIIIGGLFFINSLYAAAPDDIKTDQRVWYDAYDINGDNNYTNNPIHSSSIARWNDKSGLSQNVT